jgi:hypothetical protein
MEMDGSSLMHTALAETANGIINIDPSHEFAVTFDPDNRIVLSAMLTETNMSGVGFHIEEQSFFSGKVSDSAYPDPEKMGGDLVGNILSAPRDFVYTTAGEFKRRPYFETSVSDSYPKTSEGIPILPLNSEIEVTVTYHDPDQIGFWHKIELVKVKDRATFITTPEPIEATKFVEGVHKFKIISAFPGISRIRCKDTTYLAQFNVLELKFRQG